MREGRHAYDLCLRVPQRRVMLSLTLRSGMADMGVAAGRPNRLDVTFAPRCSEDPEPRTPEIGHKRYI